MIEFHDNIVRKTARADLLALEIAKMRAAIEIGEATGAFHVPRVLRFDERAGVADFERIDNLTNLSSLANARDPCLDKMLPRVATALALIHARLKLPPDMRIPLPPEWMNLPAEHVFLHGDFSLENVCIHEPTGRLVILDWSITPFFDRAALSYGPRYFDILWFISNIFSDTMVHFRSSTFAHGLSNVFIAVYATQPGGKMDPELFGAFRECTSRLARRILKKYRLAGPWYRRLYQATKDFHALRAFKNYEPACLRRA